MANEILDYLAANTGAVLAGAGGLVVGTVAGVALAKTLGSSGSSSSKRTGKRIKHTSRGWKQDRARRSKQKWEVAYQKRKRKKKRKGKTKKSRSRRVKTAKNGRHYIILANGRARFVK
jgi:Flp pilus assembly protein TadB